MDETLAFDPAEPDPDSGLWRAHSPAILAFALFAAGLCIAVLLARAEIGAERERWLARGQSWAENLSRTITLSVRGDIAMLRRMAARLSEPGSATAVEWRHDALLYLAHEPAYETLAIVDDRGRVLEMVSDGSTSEAELLEWLPPPSAADFRAGEMRLGDVLDRAAGVEVLPAWISIESPRFGPVRLVSAWDVDRLVRSAVTIANFPLDEFHFEIRIGGRVIHASAGAVNSMRTLAATASIRSDTQSAQTTVWPVEPAGVTPRVWLTAGGTALISLLLALVSYTAWRAISDRARLSAGEAELRRQVEARTQAEQRLRALADRLDAKVSERTRDLEQTAARLRESREEALRLMESARRTGRLAERHAIELARSNQNLELFMRVASHDMREPLRMVRSYTDLLHQRYGDELDERAQEFLGYAREGAGRMQRMLEDLLLLCRIQLDSLDLPTADTGRCLQDACANLSLLISETGAVVRHGDLLPVRADRSLLTLLFQNLVGNAIKFRGEEPPVVDITMRREEGKVRTEIRDNGLGIAPRYHARVFEPFQRLQTRDEREGSGIGLAICRRIVEWHGGEIGLDSEEGEGTTVWFTLPDER